MLIFIFELCFAYEIYNPSYLAYFKQHKHVINGLIQTFV